jgi:Tol biopolymer transport system component
VVLVLIFLLTRTQPLPTVLNYSKVSNDGLPKVSFLGYTPLATDGPRLYLSEVGGAGGSGTVRLGQVSVGGGETLQVQSFVPNPYLLDISPDHGRLLVQSQIPGGSVETPLWVLPTLGGSATRLGDILAHDGSWSHDGKWLAYANGRKLFLASSYGTEPHELASLPGIARWIRWCQDGSRLRFTVNDTATDSHSLWEVSVNGANLHPLLPGWNSPPAECCGNWIGDGNYFVFQSERDGRTQIWVLPEYAGLIGRARKEPRLLTAGPVNYYSPVPSVDGRKLFVAGSQPRGELQRYDLENRHFSSYLQGISAEGIDFSRDGQWVTYVAYPEGTLWRSKMDGSQRLQLTFLPLRVVLPRWSPDGGRIAFSGAMPGNAFHIYVISAEGSSPEQVTNGVHDEGDVSWSTDGRRLVFGYMNATSEINLAIQVLDLTTHQTSILADSNGFFSPRWSPNDRYIAAISVVGQDKLMLFDFKTGKWTELTNVLMGYPSWSRNSEYIYFDSSGDDAAFYRVRIGDHRLERLVSLKNFRRTGLYQWTGLAPDDSPLILRDVGTEEIYSLDLDVP